MIYQALSPVGDVITYYIKNYIANQIKLKNEKSNTENKNQK